MPADDPQTLLALAAIDADAASRDLCGGTPSRPSFASLYAYATDPSFVPPAGFGDALANDSGLRADMRRLLSNLASHRFARRAAAASGATVRRTTLGGSLTLTSSRADPKLAYLGIEMSDPSAKAPTMLMLIDGDGGPVRVALPSFAGGMAQVMLETSGEPYRLLADPETEAFLL